MRPNEKIHLQDVVFKYGDKTILNSVSASFLENSVTSIVGPSGVGKSTLLMTINRIWENIPSAHCEGLIQVKLDGRIININHKDIPVTEIRRKVAMVFQVPNPLPMSIFNNVAFPLKLIGIKKKDTIYDKVESALRQALLWNEVKDRLHESALKISIGQQQRLCIARALVSSPEVILLDEPTSSLDEKNTIKIEELLVSLKEKTTLIIVSHHIAQVQRISDKIFRLQDGILIPTE